MKLKNVSTFELVEELEKRACVEKISVGLYEPYELRKKYVKWSSDGTRGHITADTVLVINKENHFEGQVQEQPKFIPEDSKNGKHLEKQSSIRRPINC